MGFNQFFDSGWWGFWLFLTRLILRVSFVFGARGGPRQSVNGPSASRVSKLLAAKNCRCKRSAHCYQRFSSDELVKFLKPFWTMKKTLQDAYVPCSANTSKLPTFPIFKPNRTGLLHVVVLSYVQLRSIGWYLHQGQRQNDGCC